MRRIIAVAGTVAGSLLAAAPLAAQSATMNGKVLSVTPYAGYIKFGDYLQGPLGTSITNAGSAIYGGQVGLKLAPNVQLVGNLGYSKSDLQIGLPLLGGVSVGQSSLLLYDGGLELDVPSKGLPLTPFIQGGVGAIRYDIKQSFISTTATNLAGNVGVGADIPIGRTAAIRLMAKDYIGKFDFKDATSFGINGQTAHNVAFTGGLRLDF